MPHDMPLITTIAAALGLALVLGFVAVRLKLPALLGYLAAGVLIGPATPGFVADLELSMQLAEIGVMLLMFGVGLHFSLKDLLSVRKIAIPGAILQMTVATLMGYGLARWWGWSAGTGLVFGLCLSVASTVVLLRALEGRGQLDTNNGRIAVGWLIVEDLAMVLVLVLLPALAGWLGGTSQGGDDPWTALGRTLIEVGVFVALMLVGGKRLFPWLLWQVARTGSRELFTLCVIAAAVGIAYGSAALFGVSFALGAFFAGMVLRESALSHRAAHESLPLRDAFAVLFFVSVGMLFDPMILIDQPLRVLAVVGVITLGKTLAAFALVLALRYPLNSALTVSASLAQIGEFSFILAGLSVSLGLLPIEGKDLILAGAMLSIALNPLLFAAIEPAQVWIRKRSRLARAMELSTDPLAVLPMTVDQAKLSGHVLLVGYGGMGRLLGEALTRRGLTAVVAEESREIVEQLRERDVPAVCGDASDPAVLIQAHVARADVLLITSPDVYKSRRMAEVARMLKPDIKVLIRAHNDDEAVVLREEQVGEVFLAEEALVSVVIGYLKRRAEG